MRAHVALCEGPTFVCRIPPLSPSPSSPPLPQRCMTMTPRFNTPSPTDDPAMKSDSPIGAEKYLGGSASVLSLSPSVPVVASAAPWSHQLAQIAARGSNHTSPLQGLRLSLPYGSISGAAFPMLHRQQGVPGATSGVTNASFANDVIPKPNGLASMGGGGPALSSSLRSAHATARSPTSCVSPSSLQAHQSLQPSPFSRAARASAPPSMPAGASPSDRASRLACLAASPVPSTRAAVVSQSAAASPHVRVRRWEGWQASLAV